jgi:hypothetical protein
VQAAALKAAAPAIASRRLGMTDMEGSSTWPLQTLSLDDSFNQSFEVCSPGDIRMA